MQNETENLETEIEIENVETEKETEELNRDVVINVETPTASAEVLQIIETLRENGETYRALMLSFETFKNELAAQFDALRQRINELSYQIDELKTLEIAENETGETIADEITETVDELENAAKSAASKRWI